MIEFTSLEHTARNIMIKAVKNDAAADALEAAENGADRRQQAAILRAAEAKASRAQRQYEELRDFYQVHPTIDQLMPNK